MANPITSNALANVAKVTPSSTLAGYDGANLLDWTRPYRVWRASTPIATTDNVVIDFGATRTLQGLFLDNLNVTDVRVQGNASDSWGSPSFNAPAAIAFDRLDGRYKLFLNLTSTTWQSVGYRYLRILCDDTSTTDGSPTLQVGSVAPLATITTWVGSIGYPYEMAPQREILGQGSRVVAVGNRYAEIRMAQPVLAEGDETSFADVFGYGEAEPFLFFRNYLSTAEAYPVRRIGAASWQKIGPNAIAVPTFTFREYD